MFDVLFELLEPAWDTISDFIASVIDETGSIVADDPEILVGGAIGGAIYALGKITVSGVLDMEKLRDIVKSAVGKLRGKGEVVGGAWGKVLNDPTKHVDLGFFDDEGNQVAQQHIDAPDGVASSINKGTRIPCYS